MFRRILVPLDGSTFAEAGLAAALPVARRLGADIRLLHVLDPVAILVDEAVADAARSFAAGYLKDTAARLAADGDLQVASVVREGQVAAEIMAEAEAWDADLIAMATHGRGALSRVWLGSVADRCLQRAHRPLLLVRPDEAHDAASSYAPRRVVVPLDGSAAAEAALDAGLTLARMFAAPLDLVRVVVPHAVPETVNLPQTVGLGDQVEEEMRVFAHEYLEPLVAMVRRRGIDGGARVVTDPRPAHAILDRAPGDWVVMATRGRGGLTRALMGSVADKVVRGSHGPVLVVPPPLSPDESAPDPRASAPATRAG